jgi:predicted glycosyltransferase
MRPAAQIPSRWQVMPFIDDMPARFAEANLVMARSGASTVAELAAAAKPALLVPFAAAADNHQLRNAEEMVKAGAALLLDEKDLDAPGKLLDALTRPPAKPGAAGRHGCRGPHPGPSRRCPAHRQPAGNAGASVDFCLMVGVRGFPPISQRT